MVSVLLYPCMLCVALSIDLYVLCVVVIWLLNVMLLFSVVGCPILDRPCMVFQRVCVLCL